MNIPRRIFINSVLLFISKMFTSSSGVFFAIFLARYLGAQGYGKFSIVFAYLQFFQILTFLGIDTILTKEIAKDNSRQNILVGNAVFMKLALSLFAISVSWVFLQFMGYSQEIKNFIYVASLSILFSFGSVFTAFFQAYLKIERYVIPDLVLSLLFCISAILLIVNKFQLIYFIILQVVIIIPQTVIYIYLAKKIDNFKLRLRFDFKIWRYLFFSSLPLFLSSLYIIITLRFDQLILFKFFDAKTLGLYSAIVKLTEGLNFIPSIFMISVFPLLSSSYLKSKSDFVRIYKLSYKILSIIIIPIAFGTALLSKQIVSFIYGKDFMEASGAFSILIWSEIFCFLGSLHTSILIAAGLQRYIPLFSFIGVCSNIILNLILIPKYGIYGASFVSVISYSCLGLIPYFIFKKVRRFSLDYVLSMVKPTICSLFMSFFIYSFSSLNVVLAIIIGFSIYLLSLLITRCINEDDFRYFKQIFSFA